MWEVALNRCLLYALCMESADGPRQPALSYLLPRRTYTSPFMFLEFVANILCFLGHLIKTFTICVRFLP